MRNNDSFATLSPLQAAGDEVRRTIEVETYWPMAPLRRPDASVRAIVLHSNALAQYLILVDRGHPVPPTDIDLYLRVLMTGILQLNEAVEFRQMGTVTKVRQCQRGTEPSVTAPQCLYSHVFAS